MTAAASEVVVIRMSKQAVQKLDAAAKARGLKRSELVRNVLDSAIADESFDLAEEARRQSLLVSRLQSEKDIADFIEAAAASVEGWE